jgi:hypothetical protein
LKTQAIDERNYPAHPTITRLESKPIGYHPGEPPRRAGRSNLFLYNIFAGGVRDGEEIFEGSSGDDPQTKPGLVSHLGDGVSNLTKQSIYRVVIGIP